MADQMLSPINVNFVDSRRATTVYNSGASADNSPLTNWADLVDIETLKAALATYDSNTYTASVMRTMTVNDLVFAWRQTSSASNASGISNYIARQAVRP